MEKSSVRFAFPTPPKPKVAFYNTVKFRNYFSMTVVLVTFTLFMVYRFLIAFVLRFLTVPNEEYKDIINGAMKKDTGSLNKGRIGLKRAAYRRRLVLGSSKPQLYSTMPLNTNANTDSSNKVYTEHLRVALCDRSGDAESQKLFQKNYLPKDPADKTRRVIFGFYHPYSDANGGGEKVLWEAIYQVLKNNERNCVAIYTFTASNKSSVSSILQNVKSTFGLDFFASNPTDPTLDSMNDRIVFIQLDNKYRWFLDGSAYKRFTIVGQAFASFILGLWSVNQLCPDIWVDTMGLPFTYPFIHDFLQIPIISYVHYPLISSDMLNKLNYYKNPKDFVKYYYWKFLIFVYAYCGSFLDVGLCNSTWTLNHLNEVWKFNVDNKPTILYPPTGIDETKLTVKNSNRDKKMLYIAQFRPEKRHDLVIREYAEYLQKTSLDKPYTLVFIGSIRSDADKSNVSELQELAKDLKVSDKVEFIINAPRDQVDDNLKSCEVGLNAMWNEHFGITVVEYIQHGLIPIVHASAGPFQDIVLPFDHSKDEVLSPELGLLDETKQSGLFFKDPSDPDYKSDTSFLKLNEVMLKFETLSPEQKTQMVSNGQGVAAKKFSKSVFEEQWQKLITFILAFEQLHREEHKGKIEKYY